MAETIDMTTVFENIKAKKFMCDPCVTMIRNFLYKFCSFF